MQISSVLKMLAYSVLRIAYCVLRIAYGVWRMAYGVWGMAYGVWRMAYGVLRWGIAQSNDCGLRIADCPIEHLFMAH